METVRFIIIAKDSREFSAGYHCTKAGDQSGEYMPAESVKSLVSAAKRALIAMKNSNCDSQAEYVLQCALQDIETN